MRIVAFITFISLCSSGFCKNKKISPLNHCDCGIVPDQLINNYHRIVGGTEADINEFPWTVGLYTHYRCKGLPVCGGSLISTQHVLTAAHCIQRNTYLVRGHSICWQDFGLFFDHLPTCLPRVPLTFPVTPSYLVLST